MVSHNPILIVEDEPDGQELVTRILAIAGLSVEVVGDGEQAWGLLNSNSYHAAIIDLALPGIDGIQLLQRIRQTPALSGLPCIAVTAFHTPELKQRAIGEGFNYYFPKPIERTMLLNAIDTIKH